MLYDLVRPLSMKNARVLLIILASSILDGCFSDCTRVDYGKFRAGLYNEQKEALPNLTVAVYPIKFRTFVNPNSDLTSLAMVEDYYGVQIVETEGNGYLDIQVNDVDGTSSCDGPRETFDNAFQSIVLFYECDGGGINFQEYVRDDGRLVFSNSINQIDSAFVGSDCIH
jgi:hypothetical protein